MTKTNIVEINNINFFDNIGIFTEFSSIHNDIIFNEDGKIYKEINNNHKKNKKRIKIKKNTRRYRKLAKEK